MLIWNVIPYTRGNPSVTVMSPDLLMNNASTLFIDLSISIALFGPRTKSAVDRASASRAVGAATATADNSEGEIPVWGSSK